MLSNVTARIALRISGTKGRQAGFSPLVNIGVLPGQEGDNMDRTTLVNEKPAYIIKHTEEYILYGLIDRRVKSYNAETPGVLSIALVIPRGFQLSDDKSPYTLLCEIYNTFRTLYMEPVSDGRDAFKDVDIQDDTFRSILGEYSLQESRKPYFPMNPQGISGILKVNSDNMEELFKDSQFKEFAQFRDIEIGLDCQTSLELDSIQIPRPVEFSMYVNGNSSGIIINSYDQFVHASAKSTDNFEYHPVDFTLNEIVSSPEGKLMKDGAEIQIDLSKNRVDCNLRRVDIMYRIIIEYGGSSETVEELMSLIASGKTQLKVHDYRTLTLTEDNDLTVPAKYTSNKMSIYPFQYNGFNLLVSTTRDSDTKTLTVRISKKLIKIDPSAPVAFPSSSMSQKAQPLNGYDNPGNSDSRQYKENLSSQERARKMPSLKAIVFVFMVGLILGGGITYWVLTNVLDYKPSDENVDTQDDNTVSYPDASVHYDDGVNEFTSQDGASNSEDENIDENNENQPAPELVQPAPPAPEYTLSADDRVKYRKEILELIKAKDIKKCRAHKGWKTCLTSEERNKVENVLNPTQHEKEVDTQGTKKLKKIKNMQIRNWDDLDKLYEEVCGILNDNKKKI